MTWGRTAEGHGLGVPQELGEGEILPRVLGGAQPGLPAAQAPVGGPLLSAATGMDAWHGMGGLSVASVRRVVQRPSAERGGK